MSEFEGLSKLVDDSTETVQVGHIYLGTYASDNPIEKHVCLQWGAWCWKQALARPDEAIRYKLGILKSTIKEKL